jgi:hypothetical protein
MSRARKRERGTGVLKKRVIYEVYGHLAKHRGRTIADRFVPQALHDCVVVLDETIGLAAETVGLDHWLARTNAIIYARARVRQVQFVTANTHLRGLPGVIVLYSVCMRVRIEGAPKQDGQVTRSGSWSTAS